MASRTSSVLLALALVAVLTVTAQAQTTSNCTKSYNYLHNEIPARAACTTDCDCAGVRTCSSGRCTGTARPADWCVSPNYLYDEATSPFGANVCGSGNISSACYCDGMRTCVANSCSGSPRNATYCDSPNYLYDETMSPYGAGMCGPDGSGADCHCDGARTCVSGNCTGTARPADYCLNNGYVYNTTDSPYGPGLCPKSGPSDFANCYCSGFDACFRGECAGTSRRR